MDGDAALSGAQQIPVVRDTSVVRSVLRDFGGGRVVIAWMPETADPAPAPDEVALLVHEVLTERGLREASEIALVVPPGAVGEQSEDLVGRLTSFGIEWYPGHVVRSLDTAGRVVRFEDGAAMPFDLFLGVPQSRTPEN